MLKVTQLLDNFCKEVLWKASKKSIVITITISEIHTITLPAKFFLKIHFGLICHGMDSSLSVLQDKCCNVDVVWSSLRSAPS